LDAADATRAIRPAILVVDDDPGLRESFRLILEDEYEVLDVPDGTQALDIVRSYQVDLVLLDIRLPGMDGLDVARRLRAYSPHTPIILLTGWGTLLGEDAAEAATFDAILSKPARIPELMAALAKVTSQFVRPLAGISAG